MLGDAVTQTLPFLRAQAESMMVSTCEVHRLGTPVTDPDTGQVTTPSAVVYAGRCRVQTYEAQESNPEVGGATLTVQRYAVHVPVGSFEPAIGDVVEAITGVMDPNLTGRRYRVVALLHKSLATAYRLGVEEVP